jgi:hypothetical protein
MKNLDVCNSPISQAILQGVYDVSIDCIDVCC